ncbi:hypothetical protein JS565_25360 [Salmonella enterica subsp. enterica serovar Senftenberg]|nr:hypothetical protein [Salmonella enterica subsp. enterica serovar Senftenberg]
MDCQSAGIHHRAWVAKVIKNRTIVKSKTFCRMALRLSGLRFAHPVGRIRRLRRHPATL